MLHSVRTLVLLLGAAVGFVVFAKYIPIVRSGEQNLGTLYTSPSCPACVSLGRSLSGAGWTAGTTAGTLVNGSSTVNVVNVNASGAVVPSTISSIPAFTPAAGGSTLVGSNTIDRHLTTAAQAHAVTEQHVPPDQTPTENALTDTFQQSPTFQGAVNRLVDNVVRSFASFLQAAGLAPGAGAVSKYKNPNPNHLGYGPADRYSPPDPLHLTRLERALGNERRGRRETSVTGADPARLHQRGFSDEPNPRPLDTPALGIPGGGRPGDPFWARNCLCHASTGATAGVPYEVTNICPIFPFEVCEFSVCGPIVRHDTFVQTIAECLRQEIFDPAEEAKVERGGGRPRAPFFGL